MENMHITNSTFPSRKQLFNITESDQAFAFNHWTIEEDMKLIELFHQYKSQWTKISTYFNSRNPKQCSYRYRRLTSKCFRRKFNRTNDITLIALVDRHGQNWERISKEMPVYNCLILKERYEQIILPKKLIYSTQAKAKMQNEKNQSIELNQLDDNDIFNNPETFQNNNTSISISNPSSIFKLPSVNNENTNNASNIINTNNVNSCHQFINTNCISLFTICHPKLVVLSKRIMTEYKYCLRTINKPELKKLEVFLNIIKAEIRASSALLAKMKNDPNDFLDNELILKDRKYKVIKISQALLKFFGRISERDII